jgi:hypothetical protein
MMAVDPSASDPPPAPARPRLTGWPHNERWSLRELSLEERDWIRDHLPRATGRDPAYVVQVGLFAAVVAIGGTLLAPRALRAAQGMEAILLPAVFLAALAAAWAYDGQRLLGAIRGRRPRPALWAWRLPAVVARWEGETREGEPRSEVRCSVQGRVRTIPVTSAQLAWFPEGPAEVEMLPGGSRHLYRFVFPTHLVETYPELRRLDRDAADWEASPPSASPPATPPTDAEETARRVRQVLARTEDWNAQPRRRRRHRHQLQVGKWRIRKSDAVWLLVLLAGGATITLVAKLLAR